MLVLTRKQNEKIRIGDSIVITIVRMKGKSVRLGIEAPTDVNVLRGELVFDADSEPPKEHADQSKKTVDQPRNTSKAPHTVGAGRPKSNHWPAEREDRSSRVGPLRSMIPQRSTTS